MCKGSDLRGAASGSSLAHLGKPEGTLAAPHLVRDEVVARGVQAAGDVGQAHGDLDEKAEAGLGAAVLNHSLVHLTGPTTEKPLVTTPRRS